VQTDLRTTTLTPDEIEQGIVSDSHGYMRGGGNVLRAGTPGFSGPLERRITVGGYRIGYRVAQTLDGAYRVGTYWLD
jgi:hypothetical protein